MKGFTYYDYQCYEKYFSSNLIKKNYILKERGETYTYDEKEIYQPHDKIFKTILDNKKEAVSFLNEMLKLKNT